MALQRMTFVLLTLVLLSCQLCQQAYADGAAQAWTYAATKDWGGSCQNGTLQSPLNLEANSSDIKSQLPSPINLTYSTNLTLLPQRTSGSTQQLVVPAGNSITINGTQYNVLSMHWHTPSEHAINDVHGAAELHIIHTDSNQNLAVIGVLYNRGTVADPLLNMFLNHLPPVVPQGQTANGTAFGPVDLKAAVSNIVPNGTAGSFLTYTGSLTTPPCTEGIKWLVSTREVSITDAQIVALESAIGDNETYATNSRPIQAGSPSRLILPL